MSLSVLTVVLGNPDALTATFSSLKPFLSPDFFWTLKFSSSTSNEFLSQFEHPFVAIHQGPDCSIYDAMNQGLKHIPTSHYFVLGAGDTVLASGLNRLVSLRLAQQNFGPIFAPIIWSDSGFVLAPMPNDLSIRMSCPHPGAILSVEKSLEVGGFDTGYKIAADYDHLCRYVKAYGAGLTLDAPLVQFAGGGMSEVRAFEGALEEELIRMRVWNSHEYAVHARILRRTTLIASSLFDQVAQLHKKT